MHARSEDLYQAASRYYLEGETMEAIAHSMSVSRSTVSRLLRDARAEGIVHISVRAPERGFSELTSKLHHTFGVNATVVPVKEGETDLARLDTVARTAGRLLSEMLFDGAILGVAWGTTVGAVVNHLLPRPLPNLTVVQLNGAANHHTTGIPYVGSILSTISRAYGAKVMHFPVPAFFDFADTKQAMWRERNVQRVLEVQRRCDVAIFGVGSIAGGVPSHVYSQGYLDAPTFQTLRDEGVVGDICTVLLREDGSFADISLNARASGPTPEQLRQVGRRLCVATGLAKVRPLLGALRAGAITDLVIDDETARWVLRRAEGRR